MRISLLTGGADKPYALDLLQALVARGVTVDLIGNDEMGTAEIVYHKNVNFLNLRGNQNTATPSILKLARVLKYYVRLVLYAATTDSKVFHILWLNKFVLFDRTVLNLYYKLLGKKLVFTAHNIDERQRDGGGGLLHRLSLRCMYLLCDHILVHTRKMKAQLMAEFGVAEEKISIIPYGINHTIPQPRMSRSQAREALGVKDQEKVLLFFGNIAPYKGLEYLLEALARLKANDGSYRLLIAGQVKGCRPYWEKMEQIAAKLGVSSSIDTKLSYIPDEEVGDLFRASDVLILPYKFIFQSGVLFLSYSFGIPVIASDVGSLREYIVEGETGMICRPEDSDDLADAIARYFAGDLFGKLEDNVQKIMAYGHAKCSWDEVVTIISGVYQEMVPAWKEYPGLCG